MIIFNNNNNNDDENDGRITTWVVIYIDTLHGGNPYYHFKGTLDCFRNLD